MKSFLIKTRLHILVAAIICLYAACGRDSLETSVETGRKPSVAPDCFGSVLPPSIAPLNFRIMEPGTRYRVRFSSENSKPVTVNSTTGLISIPEKTWKSLLEKNRGRVLSCEIHIRDGSRTWKKYDTLTNMISEDPVDRYIIYRKIKPLYNYWRDISIHQRDISSFDESLIFSNKGIDSGCINCHTFLDNDPGTMIMHSRSSLGVAMLLVKDGEVKGINSRTPFGAPIAYSSWHPSGRLIAFSVNRVKQYFHSTGNEIRDVVDLDSSLGIYSVEDNAIIGASPGISKRDRLETYPAWSPDGRYLYYCSAPLTWTEEQKDYYEENVTLPENYRDVKYDLMRIGYDIENNIWGEPETVISSDITGKSIAQPKLSPDGKFLLFSMADYGCFPIYQASCDLYLLDIESGKYELLDINSDQSDSWHSWSHNSRWIVFSSKRGNGVLARLYLSHVDPDGTASKPILLPQSDPTFYDSLLETYNVPEFAVKPVTARKRSLYAANAALEQIAGLDIAVTEATPQGPKAGIQEP